MLVDKYTFRQYSYAVHKMCFVICIYHLFIVLVQYLLVHILIVAGCAMASVVVDESHERDTSESEYVYKCGGAILNEFSVITLAGCFDPEIGKIQNLNVITGLPPNFFSSIDQAYLFDSRIQSIEVLILVFFKIEIGFYPNFLL